MVALPPRLRARNLTWKIALLPLLAIVTAAALELTLGGGHVAQGPTTVVAAPPELMLSCGNGAEFAVGSRVARHFCREAVSSSRLLLAQSLVAAGPEPPGWKGRSVP